jgi:hypothetical protein
VTVVVIDRVTANLCLYGCYACDLTAVRPQPPAGS